MNPANCKSESNNRVHRPDGIECAKQGANDKAGNQHGIRIGIAQRSKVTGRNLNITWQYILTLPVPGACKGPLDRVHRVFVVAFQQRTGRSAKTDFRANGGFRFHEVDKSPGHRRHVHPPSVRTEYSPKQGSRGGKWDMSWKVPTTMDRHSFGGSSVCLRKAVLVHRRLLQSRRCKWGMFPGLSKQASHHGVPHSHWPRHFLRSYEDGA